MNIGIEIRHTFLCLKCFMVCEYVCIYTYVCLTPQHNEKEVDINGERLKEGKSGN